MTIPADFEQTNLFLKDELKRTLPTLYRNEYDELWGLNPARNFHQAIGDLPLGLEFIEAWIQSDAGKMAALYDGLSDDIPLVEITFGKKQIPVAMFVQGMDYNTLQVEKYRLAQQLGQHIPSMNIISAKQNTVRDYLDRREHHIVLYGVPKKGIPGIFSIATPDDDATFRPYVKAADAFTMGTHELYNFFKDLIYRFISNAKLSTPSQVGIKIPPALNMRLLEIYQPPTGVTTTGVTTVRQMLLSETLGMGIGSIESHNELQGAELNKHLRNSNQTGMHPTNRDRIVLKAIGYNATRHFYTRRTFPVFQTHTLRFEQMTIQATSGLMNIRPEKYEIYDFDNAVA